VTFNLTFYVPCWMPDPQSSVNVYLTSSCFNAFSWVFPWRTTRTCWPGRPGMEGLPSTALSGSCQSREIRLQQSRDIRLAEVAKELASPSLPQRPSDDIVTWAGADDPARPINWSSRERWKISLAMMFFSFVNTFTRSVCSPAIEDSAHHLHTKPEVMRLGVSLFVLGSCFGPLIWAPLSELVGRKKPLFVGMLVSTVFNIPVAVAKNVETVLICRFLGGGPFGCAGLTIAPVVTVDTLPPLERGISLVFLVACMLIAPCLGPVFGALVSQHGHWRWTACLAFIVEVVAFLFGAGVIRETSEETLLKRKKRMMRGRDARRLPLQSKIEAKMDHAPGLVSASYRLG
jgi:Major Facilitator Superfamily